MVAARNAAMVTRISVLAAALSTATATAAAAADEFGRFMGGGGVGGVVCTSFLNSMTTARQMGFNTPAGTQEISSYVMYVLGFQTGYNWQALGVYDVFAAFGDRPGIEVLFGVERVCEQTPAEIFRDALMDFVELLGP